MRIQEQAWDQKERLSSLKTDGCVFGEARNLNMEYACLHVVQSSSEITSADKPPRELGNRSSNKPKGEEPQGGEWSTAPSRTE